MGRGKNTPAAVSATSNRFDTVFGATRGRGTLEREVFQLNSPYDIASADPSQWVSQPRLVYPLPNPDRPWPLDLNLAKNFSGGDSVTWWEEALKGFDQPVPVTISPFDPNQSIVYLDDNGQPTVGLVAGALGDDRITVKFRDRNDYERRTMIHVGELGLQPRDRNIFKLTYSELPQLGLKPQSTTMLGLNPSTVLGRSLPQVTQDTPGFREAMERKQKECKTTYEKLSCESLLNDLNGGRKFTLSIQAMSRSHAFNRVHCDDGDEPQFALPSDTLVGISLNAQSPSGAAQFRNFPLDALGLTALNWTKDAGGPIVNDTEHILYRP